MRFLHLLFLLPALACSSTIQPSADAHGGGMDFDMQVQDAGVDALLDADSDVRLDAGSDARMDAFVSADASAELPLCGFAFEREAPPMYTAVWGTAPDNLWFVQRDRGVHHWNGTMRTALPVPSANYSGHIAQLTGTPSGTPWLVGSQTVRDEPGIWSWEDGEWIERTVPGPFSSFRVVALADNDVWALARIAESADWSVHHFDGAEWRAVDVPLARWNFLDRYDDGAVMLQTRSENEPVQFFVSNGRAFYEVQPPTGFPTRDPLIHRPLDEGELWMSTRGVIWDGVRWWDGWTGGSTYVRAAGQRAGSIWAVSRNSMLQIDDLTDLDSATVHDAPVDTSLSDAVIPASGPPVVAGNGIHYWNGARWDALEPSRPALYDGPLDGFWGESSDDYWVWARALRHVQGGIAQSQSAPPDCSEGSILRNAHRLSATDLVAETCNGLQRLRDGVFSDMLLPIKVAYAGLSTALWSEPGEAPYAYMNDTVYRFDGRVFDVEWSAVFEGRFNGTLTRWPALMAGDADGRVYVYARGGEAAHDAVFRKRDGSWDWTPPFESGPAGFPPNSMHLDSEGRLWLSARERGDLNRVWRLEDDAWFVEELAQTVPAQDAHFGGRGDVLWLVSENRTIWRREAGEWARDDRCVESEQLRNVRFENVWFPPDGPPRVFVDGGGVLVWRGGPE